MLSIRIELVLTGFMWQQKGFICSWLTSEVINGVSTDMCILLVWKKKFFWGGGGGGTHI